MSYNKYNEFMLCRYNYHDGPYFISRDIAGNCVLRLENEDGAELFAAELDDGTKNKKNERVHNAVLLMDKIDELTAKAK